MYYVAGPQGFLTIKNTYAGKNRTAFLTDIREATPFATYEAADAEARSRIKPAIVPHILDDGTYMAAHYVILNTNHAPMIPADGVNNAV